MTEPMYSYAWLEKQTDDELKQMYTNIASGPPSDPMFYLQVLSIRAQDRATTEQARINAGMHTMTGVITWMTCIMVAVAIAQFLVALLK